MALSFARSMSRVFRVHKTKQLENVLASVNLLHTSAKRSSPASSPSLTTTATDGGIQIITLNNSKKRNALSLAMLESLEENLHTGASDQDVRVIILRSEGDVFSAGHDLKELRTDTGIDFHKKVFDKCFQVMTLVQDIEVPVIAQVKGLATAAGCQLVASCDIALASDMARFATPGVSVGIFCSTPAVAVARCIPRKVAMEMLFTGEPINAADALRHGLVSRVVPLEELENETMRIAKRICETSRPVVALGKACFYKQIALDRDQAYKLAGDVMVDNLRLVDSQEGIEAFVQKRHPKWTNKSEKAH